MSETHPTFDMRGGGSPTMVRVAVVSGEQVYSAWKVRYRTPSNQKWREFYLLLMDDEQGVPTPDDITKAIQVYVRNGG